MPCALDAHALTNTAFAMLSLAVLPEKVAMRVALPTRSSMSGASGVRIKRRGSVTPDETCIAQESGKSQNTPMRQWTAEAPCRSSGQIFMTSFDYALTVGLFAGLLFWKAWRERAADNKRDAWLLLVLGVLTGLIAVAVALIF